MDTDDKNIMIDKGVVLSSTYAIANVMEFRNNERSITAQEVTHEQENDSFCWQASSTVGLPKLACIYNNIAIFRCIVTITGTVKICSHITISTLVLSLYYPGLAGNPDEGRISTVCNESIFGHMWPRLCIRLWVISTIVPKQTIPYMYTPPVTIFGKFSILLHCNRLQTVTNSHW